MNNIPEDKGINRNRSSRASARRKGIDYLLVIGINAYEHLPLLHNAVNDAQVFSQLLTLKYQFDPDHVNALYDEQATKVAIDDAFLKLISQVKATDNLVVYFTGHGDFEKEVNEGYWVPVDAEKGKYTDYISNSRLRKYIESITAHHIFIISDACFSGAFFTPKSAHALDRLGKHPSRWLLTSGRTEIVSDGRAGDHSPFADNLLYYLGENKDSTLPAMDLINFVVNTTTENARQTPRGEPLNLLAHKGGQFIFKLKKEAVTEHIKTEAGNADFLEAYAQLLHRHGQASIRSKVAIMEEQSFWKEVKRQDTVAAYVAYLNKYQKGVFTKKANEKITAFQKANSEDDFWKSAQETGLTRDYLKYLQCYPQGKHKEAAEEFLYGSIGVIGQVRKLKVEDLIEKDLFQPYDYSLTEKNELQAAETKTTTLAIAVAVITFLLLVLSFVLFILS